MLHTDPAPATPTAPTPSTVALPWVVVLDPGTYCERIDSEHETQRTALRTVLGFTRGGASADLMKRLPDGTLSTDF
jgi:hypothetical protein